MASAAAKATRRAVARNRLDEAVTRLADQLGIEIATRDRSVKDPELAAIVETEAQADLLERISGAITERTQAHEETTQKVVALIAEAVSGRESLSDAEKADLAQIVAEVTEAVTRAPEPEPKDGVNDDEPNGEGETPSDDEKHPGNVYLVGLTRDELNALATEKGIDHPEKLPNKVAVVAAIVEATPPAGDGDA